MVCRRRHVHVLLFLLALACRVPAEPITLEFASAPLADILVALGRASGRSIVPDETVSGSASYFFANMEFEEALHEFARRFDLFIDEQDGIYSVSAIRVTVHEDGTLDVDAPRVGLATLLRHLSRATRTPILAERLPDREISYYGERLPLSGILDQLATQLPTHHLDERSGAYLLAYDEPARRAHSDWIERAGDEYSIRSGPATLPELARVLFESAGREYQLFTRAEPRIAPLHFSGKSFDELLTLILERGNASFSVVDDVYHVRDTAPLAAGVRGLATEIVALERLGVSALLDLLPAEQTADVTVRPDRGANVVTVTGTPASVRRVHELIVGLDARPAGEVLRRVELTSIRAADLTALLPPHLRSLRITPIPDSAAVTILGTESRLAEFEEVLALIDAPRPTHLVELSHIRVDELRAHLPRSASDAQIVPTTDDQRFFFTGSADAHRRFLVDIERIDRPVPQIRYHLLVVQHQQGEGQEFDLNLMNALTTPESVQAIVGSVGNLLSLNVDVISAFGYQFAARLNANLRSSRAAIVADTTLSGLSGEAVSFRNTSTYRYRDIVVDPGTGAQHATGVVREISSGLILEISGRTSGDDVIMDVAATVSRRGTNTAGSGNPPPTSEKVVRTQVRATSGTPVILSGLRLHEDESSISETPLLGRIPLLGALFRGRSRHADSTELAIYIIPRIDADDEHPATMEEELMTILQRNFGADE